jgi:DNA-binding NarL/FixJ family response regulator
MKGVEPMDQLRVVVADDSALIREGVASLLADEGFEVCGKAGDVPGLLDVVRVQRPDVAIVDIRMPGDDPDGGIGATHQIREETAGATAVLVLSQYLEPDFAVRLLEEDGRGIGYLLKDRITDVAEFVDAVRRVARGGSVIDPAIVSRLLGRRRRGDPLEALSEREHEVLALMAAGRSNRAIARSLSLSEKTVEAYIGSVFGKLGLEPAEEDHRRVRAVLVYLQEH